MLNYTECRIYVTKNNYFKRTKQILNMNQLIDWLVSYDLNVPTEALVFVVVARQDEDNDGSNRLSN